MSKSYNSYQSYSDEDDDDHLETKDYSFLSQDESLQHDEGAYNDEDEEEEEQMNDDAAVETESQQPIKMSRKDLIAQLEKLGYNDVPEEVVQDFINELRNQNIEVEPEEVQQHVALETHQDEYEEEEFGEEEQEHNEEHDLDDEDEVDEDAFIPAFQPPVLNDDVVSISSTSSKRSNLREYREQLSPSSKPLNSSKLSSQKQPSPKVLDFGQANRSPIHTKTASEVTDIPDDDEGYDTATYYSNHYSSLRDGEDDRMDDLTVFTPKKNLEPPQQTIPQLPSHDTSRISHDEYHQPRSSREFSQHEPGKVKFKPLEQSNYTPPTLPVYRPKSAPPVKTPVKTPPREPAVKTPSKEVSPKERDIHSARSPGMRSSISSNVSEVSSIPRTSVSFKANTRKPVTYRKKVNDPVARWREMNNAWKNDKFLKNQQSQQKDHRWRVRQEMMEIQGDQYLPHADIR